MLDEPFEAVDPVQRSPSARSSNGSSTRADRRWSRATVTTLIEDLCDHVGVISKGRMVATSSTRSAMTDRWTRHVRLVGRRTGGTELWGAGRLDHGSDRVPWRRARATGGALRAPADPATTTGCGPARREPGDRSVVLTAAAFATLVASAMRLGPAAVMVSAPSRAVATGGRRAGLEGVRGIGWLVGDSGDGRAPRRRPSPALGVARSSGEQRLLEDRQLQRCHLGAKSTTRWDAHGSGRSGLRISVRR